MKRILWLDDRRDPNALVSKTDTWATLVLGDEALGNTIVWVRTYKEFVSEVLNVFPDIVCFDHDLGDELDGKDAAKWLVNYCQDADMQMPVCYSQSANPTGRRDILSLVEQFRKFQHQ